MLCIHNGIILNGVSEEGNGAVLIDGTTIVDVFSKERFEQKTFPHGVTFIDAGGNYIAPGFIDTHIHGFKGHGTDNYSVDGFLQMSDDLAHYGVTAFNATIYPASEEHMTGCCRAVAAAIGKETGARIMGIHLEGPFISPLKLGVQRPETVRLPDIALMERLWNAAAGHIVNMTVAPELKGMRELVLWCADKGIVLQAGHTNAEYHHMKEGIQAGILHATHLFNAMSQLHHRDPGAAGAVLIHPEMSCEIIADGIHVHPDLFKLLQRDKTTSHIVLITDALTPTEQRADTLFANGEEVVFKYGCFHRKTDDVIAGSALTMMLGIKNLTAFGFSLADAVSCATANPARIMKYTHKGIISHGYDSDLVVFDKEYSVRLAMVGGTVVKNTL
ncbi:MAG: N-acetylglucosamine-6-phosphate deacetylase [Treponema sp.]|nr:N-acetylglucosamine-6-phosphate deacetylase [Treponema sp.]